MKIFLEEQQNVVVVYCKKKRAELKIVYKDIDTDEVILEEVRGNLNIGDEVDIDLTVPKNYELMEKEEIEEEKTGEMVYDEILEEMKRFRDDLNGR